MQNETQIFPPKEVAMELRWVGFNELCVGWYNSDHQDDCTEPIIEGDLSKNSEFLSSCTAPTYDQVIGWFAEVHGIDIHTVAGSEMNFYWTNIFGKDGLIEQRGEQFTNRQQSLLTAFREAIKLIEK